MARGMVTKIVLVALFSILIVSGMSYAAETMSSPTATMGYGEGVGKKLGRGLANVAFGWLDIPKGIEEVGDQNNILAAVTWGPLYGAGNALVRTLAGVYEVATFPIALPPNFEPLVQPEFVLENDRMR